MNQWIWYLQWCSCSVIIYSTLFC